MRFEVEGVVMMMMAVAVCRHPVRLVCGVSVGWCKVVTSLTDTEHESLPRVIPDLVQISYELI